ncbi:hypothetical protein C1646_774025 [Rhizophagus diaphanus]|nr:hypothetical protein C1646_774025 [Rhizophagus diaphanus] [Rhizophagus sp. MUCL 43196]
MKFEHENEYEQEYEQELNILEDLNTNTWANKLLNDAVWQRKKAAQNAYSRDNSQQLNFKSQSKPHYQKGKYKSKYCKNQNLGNFNQGKQESDSMINHSSTAGHLQDFYDTWVFSFGEISKIIQRRNKFLVKRWHHTRDRPKHSVFHLYLVHGSKENWRSQRCYKSEKVKLICKVQILQNGRLRSCQIVSPERLKINVNQASETKSERSVIQVLQSEGNKSLTIMKTGISNRQNNSNYKRCTSFPQRQKSWSEKEKMEQLHMLIRKKYRSTKLADF